MTAAEEICARQARCQPHLLRLRGLAAGAGTPAGGQAPAEIRQAASAVLAEVTAAGRAWPGTGDPQTRRRSPECGLPGSRRRPGGSNRGPMTASSTYQVIARRGRECGIEAFPHPSAIPGSTGAVQRAT